MLYGVFYIAGAFNEKIKEAMDSRKRLFEELILKITALDKTKKLIWFHASSMGEFEQAKPIIQSLKEEGHYNIIATFFSPSGYKNNKNYMYADIISYLPFDFPAYARRFVKIVHPDIAVMMRYDIWPNIIWNLNEEKIPCYIVDATMRSDSSRLLPLSRGFHKLLFNTFSGILTVSQADAEAFAKFGIDTRKVKVVGDTRFDRVYLKSIGAKEKKLFKENFFEGKKVIVAGSSWEADEEVIVPAFIKATKYDTDSVLILVPHEPTIQNLERIEGMFKGRINTIRLSSLNGCYNNERVIVVDSIGILLTLYYYADLAYVGGSFKQGIHNVLEPAVYGIPVFFGPKIENSQEAITLVKIGAAGIIKNQKEAYRTIRTIFSDNNLRESMGAKSYDYVHKNTGATSKIIAEIQSPYSL
jgi:3-deoxy-D-manno-octulosonic-acid transferase